MKKMSKLSKIEAQERFDALEAIMQVLYDNFRIAEERFLARKAEFESFLEQNAAEMDELLTIICPDEDDFIVKKEVLLD